MRRRWPTKALRETGDFVLAISHALAPAAYEAPADCKAVCGTGRLRHRRSTISRRDFVPWRFSAAGRRSGWLDHRCRRLKPCTTAA
jgi:hypothetical protein